MNKEKLSVIIISFNSARILIKNLEVLINENLFNFVIVDNASDDDSSEVIKSRFPNIKLISFCMKAMPRSNTHHLFIGDS